MKNILIASILTMVLVGCSDSEPPVYKSGMTKYEYGEKFGDWLGDKFASSNEADIESYREKSIELVDSFKKKAINIRSSEEAIKLVDNLLADIIVMTENKFKLSKENWIFIANPKVDASASKRSQLEIKYVTNLTVEMLDLGYLPTTVSNVIARVFRDKENGSIYYEVLKESKFPKIIANDEWLKDYETKKVVVDTAVRIAKSEKLYFDVKVDGYGKLENQKSKIKKLRFRIKKLRFRYKFNLIDSYEIVGYNRNNRSIFEFKEIVESKSKKDYESVFNKLTYAKRDLKNSKKYLSKKEAYLKKNPDTDWAKKDVVNLKQDVKKYTKALEQANIEFDQVYNKELGDLNSQIQEIKTLEANMESSLSKYNHNIQVFIKTYSELTSKGYDSRDVADFLTQNRWFDFEKYDAQKNIKLEHLDDDVAFSNYMESMADLLNIKEGM